MPAEVPSYDCKYERTDGYKYEQRKYKTMSDKTSAVTRSSRANDTRGLIPEAMNPKLWVIEEMWDGDWEITPNGETLEIFTEEEDAREALTEWKSGGDAEFYRLVIYTRDADAVGSGDKTSAVAISSRVNDTRSGEAKS